MNRFAKIKLPRLTEKSRWIFALGAGTTACGILYVLENTSNAAEFVAHHIHNPWSHNGPLDSLDMASVRRGYQVYKQVCSACHAQQFIRYRHFINNFMTEDEAKAEAAEALIDDIDDQGKAIKRPGLINDYLPKPYPNQKAAAAANNGAAPPDLSLMSWAREGGDNYIFNLLTGYGFDTPEGVSVDEGKAYNPYFPNGSVLAMPQQLFDEGIEYEDGTPATMSQQAKDVATYLRWSAEQWHDTRKKLAIKLILMLPIVWLALFYAKRHAWSYIKSEKYFHRVVKGREWNPDSTQPPPPKGTPPVKEVLYKQKK